MRRIPLLCAFAVVLLLPAAAARGAGAHATSGYLVVRNAANDGGVTGRPVVTVVVAGFVLGRVSQEGRVDVYHLASSAKAAPQASGQDVSRRAVRWRGLSGVEFSGSDFRFRAAGGLYRVVVRGSGVYLFTGGRGTASLVGSRAYPLSDGRYSLNGRAFRSLPAGKITVGLGGG